MRSISRGCDPASPSDDSVSRLSPILAGSLTSAWDCSVRCVDEGPFDVLGQVMDKAEPQQIVLIWPYDSATSQVSIGSRSNSSDLASSAPAMTSSRLDWRSAVGQIAAVIAVQDPATSGPGAPSDPTGKAEPLSTICVMAEPGPVPGPDESLPWSLLPKPPALTALEAAMRDLDEAMQPSTTMQESVRLLESASLGIFDVADRIEEYLPEAEATLTRSLRGRGHDPAVVAAGAAADRMLAGLRYLAEASRAYAATLDDPDVDDSVTEQELRTARTDAFASLRALVDGAT